MLFKMLSVAFYSLAGIFYMMWLAYGIRRDLTVAAVLTILGLTCTSIIYATGGAL